MTKPWYWLTIVAARTAGTTLGDLLASRRGLGLGLDRQHDLHVLASGWHSDLVAAPPEHRMVARGLKVRRQINAKSAPATLQTSQSRRLIFFGVAQTSRN